MRKILIFGNSGSGKSTLARQLADSEGLPHLDLDTLAWRDEVPPRRQAPEVSYQAMQEIIGQSDGWIAEGCYADLLAMLVDECNEMIFMNLPLDDCLRNARLRPWEPHKYESEAAQNANLPMLLEWIRGYDERDDELSRAAHQRLYDSFDGTKQMITANGPAGQS
jgi:adenylate kinase family enzyme